MPFNQMGLSLTIASTFIGLVIAIWKFVWEIRDRKCEKARRSRLKATIGEKFPRPGRPKTKRTVDPTKPPIRCSDKVKI